MANSFPCNTQKPYSYRMRHITPKVELWLLLIDMKTTQISRYASNSSIEAVSITSQLPHNTQIQIALLYTSPSAPLTSRVLNHVSMSYLPCIILGDFNDDMQNNDNQIVTFMSSSRYTQLVKSPTARGTLIDHVYYNRLPDSIQIQVQDTY